MIKIENDNNDDDNYSDNDDKDNNNDINDDNNKIPVDSPHKRPIMLSFDVTIVESKNNCWVWWFETPCPSRNVIVIVRRAGLLWLQQDFEWWWSVPLPSASLYQSFLLFCLICVYSSQFSILFWIMYLL